MCWNSRTSIHIKGNLDEGQTPLVERTDPAGGRTDPAGGRTDPAGGRTDPLVEISCPGFQIVRISIAMWHFVIYVLYMLSKMNLFSCRLRIYFKQQCWEYSAMVFGRFYRSRQNCIWIKTNWYIVVQNFLIYKSKLRTKFGDEYHARYVTLIVLHRTDTRPVKGTGTVASWFLFRFRHVLSN